MALRVCNVPGCGTTFPPHSSGKCVQHRREADKARGTRQQRGYDAHHDRLRAAWQRKLDAGRVVWCWRCAQQGRHTRIDPMAWHLGHDDNDRRMYRGPECPPCNLATSSHK